MKNMNNNYYQIFLIKYPLLFNFINLNNSNYFYLMVYQIFIVASLEPEAINPFPRFNNEYMQPS